ncbi:hypothetical protein SLS60_006954 [Paraconiothyrium brasiliense]|uniref:Heterokaryon incompatibility domain-containing protein n=1 Tax=Paraconiothyrium brasiliense TaxID=300254 RepID=A0ABR3R8N1_9PLEO
MGEHGKPLLAVSAEQAAKFDENARQVAIKIRQLNLAVLDSMSLQVQVVGSGRETEAGTKSPPPQKRSTSSYFQKKRVPGRLTSLPDIETYFPTERDRHLYTYSHLARETHQIRLFSLSPQTAQGHVQGTFHKLNLASLPRYTALSYTWGDPRDLHEIVIDNFKTIKVRKNLFDFLQRQSSIITEPKYFWIDAVCINQSNMTERNHQVSLMKDIYVQAHEVYIWLGPEKENSDLAMDYLAMEGSRGLRRRGPGYYPLWKGEQGQALVHLCERPYWRRMWIIQEIAHAGKITVWCGSKSVEWSLIEQLYLTLKTLEDESWWAHHQHAIAVLQSAAAVMVWQRAHWRHARTSTPTLKTLIEIFRDWRCVDVRDKVFALLSMASESTAIEANYSMAPRDIYFAVRDKHPDAGWVFDNLLSQVLGLSHRDIQLNGQDL